MTQIIAEIGWSHGGDMLLAKQMVKAAAENRANYAKFQTWQVKNLKDGPWMHDGRKEIYEKAELTDEMHLELIKFCKENYIEFLTAVFSKEDAERVAQWCEKVKIPSPEVTNYEMLEVINESFEEVFMSIGASTYDEVKKAIDILKKPKLTLLHCVSSYPCPYDKVNLPKIKEMFGLYGHLKGHSIKFGYSGHALGINDAIAALEYDVSIIEKHFTIDNNLPGRDNKFAILPEQLVALSQYISCRELMNTPHDNQYQSCEEEVRDVYRGRWQN